MSERVRSERQTINAGEDVEQREILSTAGRTVETMGQRFLKKRKTRNTMSSNDSTARCSSNGKIMAAPTHTPCFSSMLCDGQTDMETDVEMTRTPISAGVG